MLLRKVRYHQGAVKKGIVIIVVQISDTGGATVELNRMKVTRPDSLPSTRVLPWKAYTPGR